VNYGWRPYVSAAERRRKAERAMAKLAKKGHRVSPVVIEGRTIARSFWGRAWCENLERYGDFSNRLPRGRTYVRNGSVLDLQIAPRAVQALVGGSEIYRVAVRVSAVRKARWESICTDCSGAIDSLVELLQGRFSKGVMERICRQRTGLFPSPREIEFSCTCPDWASMCKHVAAVLYGVGARLDAQPELLFRLREVAERDLIASAGVGLSLAKAVPAPDKLLRSEGLSELFGLDLATPTGETEPSRVSRKPARDRPSLKRSARVKEAAPVAKTRRQRASLPANKKRAPKPGPRTRSRRKPKQPSSAKTRRACFHSAFRV